MNSITISINFQAKFYPTILRNSRPNVFWKKVFLKISQNSQENTCAVYCPFLFIENLTFPSSILFPINIEGSKRTTNRIGHFSSKTKSKPKKNRYNLMTESLLYNRTTSRFKFIRTLTCGKTCGLCRRNGAITLPSGKPRTVENMLLQPVPSES